MKNLLKTASFLALVSFAYPAAAVSVFDFSLDGWSDGGVFEGAFVGEDTNNDGQISSFDGEVISFDATYSSSQVEIITFSSLDTLPFGGDFPDQEIAAPTGLVFTLDGSGQLGDDFFGDSEGLAVFSDFHYLALGPGPFNQCTGDFVCGGLFNAASIVFPINVANFSVETDGDIILRDDDIVVSNEIGLLPEEAAIATNTNPILVTGDIGEPDGQFEFDPILPGEINEDGGFVFNLDDIRFLPREIFFIDPEIATGYTYTITGDTFFSVQAPSLGAVADGDGLYTLEFEGMTVTLAAGELFEFGPGGVSSFIISGIDPALMLDPTNTNAFVTGVSVVSRNQGAMITQTPITTDINAVPLPAGGVLLLTGLAGLALVRRRRTAHAD